MFAVQEDIARMGPKDRVTEVLLEALRQGMAVPGEHRLYRAGKLDGLFPGRSGAGGEAAARALASELIRTVRVDTRGKTRIEWVEITPRGVEYLHAHESPVHVLHELRATLQANQQAMPAWLESMRGALSDLQARLTADAARWQQRLEAMERRIGDTLRRLEAVVPLAPPEVLEAHPWTMDALNYLDRRRAAGTQEGCPLPELYDAVSPGHRGLDLPAFHDGLRKLRQRRAIEVRPLDDPTRMTKPEFALLDGDGVYYLALR